MFKTLLPVDGSENSDRAVQYLIRMVEHCGAMDVHLMNVQPPFLYVEVLLKPRQEVIDTWTHKAGHDATRSACALLDAAGILYTLELVEGEVAETLVRYAEQVQCDMIVMGTRGMGTVANLVLGSVATKVIHLTHIPVTLIK
ncbi:MAG: universal stress protein [Sulfuriferula sp.]